MKCFWSVLAILVVTSAAGELDANDISMIHRENGRELDTTATINALIADLEFTIELGPFNIDCDRFFIGALNFLSSEVTIVDGLERILIDIQVDDFEARCRAAGLRFTSDETVVNFKLEFFSPELGRIIPIKGQVPQDFNCEEDFLQLNLNGVGTGIIEDDIPGLACQELEPLFQNLTALLSDNVLIDIAGERPPVAPDVSGVVPVAEVELTSAIPEGFEYHDSEKLDALLESWKEQIADTVLVKNLKEQINNVIAALIAEDVLGLVFALETLVFVLVGIQVPIPESIAAAIIEIDFSEGLGEALAELLANLDLSIGSLISLILELLGIDFGSPSPDDFLASIEMNPIAKALLDAANLTPMILHALNEMEEARPVYNIAGTTTVNEALTGSRNTRLLRFLKQFPFNENLSIVLSQLFDIPASEFLFIFTAFSEEEINGFLDKNEQQSVRELISEIFVQIFPQNLLEAYDSALSLSKLDTSGEARAFLERFSVENDHFGFNVSLGDFGVLFLTFQDFAFDFDVALDGELAGFSFESSLIFPKILFNNLGLSVTISFEITQGDQAIISDTLTISGALSGFTQEALTLIFSYEDLFDYGFKNAVDLISAIRVVGDLFGCAMANSGVALSAQSTSLDITASLDSTESFDGFLEDLVNSLLFLYLPFIPTAIENLLAGLRADSFFTITALEEGCTRQGFVEGEAVVDEVSEIFTNIEDAAFIVLAVAGMILMSMFAVFYIFKREMPPNNQIADESQPEEKQDQTL